MSTLRRPINRSPGAGPYKFLWYVAAVCALSVLATCAPAAPTEIVFFYSPTCKSCSTGYGDLSDVAILGEIASRNKGYTFRAYEVSGGQEASDALIEAIDRNKIPLERQRLPLLLVNGRAYSSRPEVKAEIEALSHGRR
jgi:hypothetical protein